MTSQSKHSLSSRAAKAVQSADSCGAAAAALPPVAAPKLFAARVRWSAALLLGLALAAFSVACSDNTKAAPTKQEITVDPNLMTVDHPELSRLSRWRVATYPRNSTPTGRSSLT